MSYDGLSLIRWLQSNKVPFFNRTFTWHVNGKRGHLHASTGCEKYKRSDRAFSMTATFADAETHTVCPACVHQLLYGEEGRGLLEGTRVLRQEFLLLAHNRDVLAKSDDDMTRQKVRLSLRGIADSVAERGFHVDLAALAESIGDQARTLADSLVVDTAVLDRRLRMLAAVEVFHRSLNGTDDLDVWQVTDRDTAVLGKPERYAYRGQAHLSPLLQDFIRLVSGGATPAEVARTLDLSEALASPNSMELLAGCDATSPAPGEDVLTYAVRRWREEATVVCRAVLDRWAQRVEELAAADEWFLLPAVSADRERVVRYVNDSNSAVSNAALIFMSQRWFVHESRGAILCPKAIAEWASIGRQLPALGLRGAVAVNKDISDTAAHTAVALWDPHSSYDMYCNFEPALAAATKL